MIPEVEALRREVADLRASQLQLEDVRSWLEGRPQPSAQNTVEPHSVRENSIGMLPFCYVWKTADQAIANGTVTVLTWSQPVLETTNPGLGNPYGMWSSTANTRITPTRRGWYLAQAMCGWAANATGDRLLQIRKNGADSGVDWSDERQAVASAGNGTRNNCSGLYYMNGTTDYLEVVVYQASGGALNIASAGNDGSRSKFAVVWQHDNVAPSLPA